jgi:prolyl-tRNA editing enzyme YbaK/EbsC (Cys-tRNA(Pro) deacylase)
MLIDIPYEAVSKIVTEELKESLHNLQVDYQARKNGGIAAGVFNANCEVDLRKIKKTMRALKRVLYYYGENLDE